MNRHPSSLPLSWREGEPEGLFLWAPAREAQISCKATPPAATITSFPLSQTYRDNTNKVIAHWEDGQYSLNLYPILVRVHT